LPNKDQQTGRQLDSKTDRQANKPQADSQMSVCLFVCHFEYSSTPHELCLAPQLMTREGIVTYLRLQLLGCNL